MEFVASPKLFYFLSASTLLFFLNKQTAGILYFAFHLSKTSVVVYRYRSREFNEKRKGPIHPVWWMQMLNQWGFPETATDSDLPMVLRADSRRSKRAVATECGLRLLTLDTCWRNLGAKDTWLRKRWLLLLGSSQCAQPLMLQTPITHLREAGIVPKILLMINMCHPCKCL